LAHFSPLHDAHLELDSGPATVEHTANDFCMCLKSTFSGSTK